MYSVATTRLYDVARLRRQLLSCLRPEASTGDQFRRLTGGAMADVLVNGIRLHYQVHGTGTPLVLAHGYGATLDMWAGQIGAFSQRYQVVVYDTRGHGRTEAPRE